MVYKRLYNHFSPEHFWKRVDKKAAHECWPWMAGLFGNGYGQVWKDGRGHGAHIISWELANEKTVPDGLLVLHSCDNHQCVNPNHLSIGTHLDNMADMVRKGRQTWGDKNPSRLYPEKVAKGEKVHGSKLNPDAIRWIRKRFDDGEQQNSIAKFLGITQSLVSMVVNRVVWKHVA